MSTRTSRRWSAACLAALIGLAGLVTGTGTAAAAPVPTPAAPVQDFEIAPDSAFAAAGSPASALASAQDALATPAVSAAAPTVPIRPTGSDPQPRFPIRAAFYYGWGSTSSHFTATYGTDDPYAAPGAPRRNVTQMRYAGLNAGIASWMGQGSFADVRFPYQLRAADGTPFRWSLYYEPAGRSYAQINSDLTYIRGKYGIDKNFLRVGGKPVLFVWAGGSFSCSQAQTWVQANQSRFYLVFKVFPGYTGCPYKPRAWHEYGPVHRIVTVPGNSAAVSPGFWHTNSSSPILARDPRSWDLAIKQMVGSRVPWQLVTSYNEWGEGTAVETANQWRSGTPYGRYLDLLHVNLWRSGV
ncbi:hypothetical protein GIS00_02995 [Nakamurella sp. YIM 132087]|uniref:GH26 domain-containing protein n=1 Tax=Nakamurella alba TaxID=2665158 RepID=A0A7K1FFM8_9ACTN|nr:hypothetical protein [Nakamurella alba]MTD12912.1 hypothetical protein [Nakamurella alba]